jgi:hypothetical protein
MESGSCEHKFGRRDAKSMPWNIFFIASTPRMIAPEFDFPLMRREKSGNAA